MDLSIVIVTYNSERTIKPCLESIYNETGACFFEIIVVDNDSKDSTVSQIRDNFPDVKVIEPRDNIGYAKANNLGARVAKGKYLLFLNPDTHVTNGALEKMVQFFHDHEDRKIGLIGPSLYHPDGSIQPSCREFPTLKNMLTHALFLNKLFPKVKLWGNYMMTYFDFRKSQRVEWLTGACILTSKHLFSDIGLFDERFFMFSEDVDLCRRYKAAGYDPFFYSEVSIIHLEGGASGVRSVSRAKLEQESTNLLWQKYYPVRYCRALKTAIVLYCLLRILLWGTLALIPYPGRKRAWSLAKYYVEILKTAFYPAQQVVK